MKSTVAVVVVAALLFGAGVQAGSAASAQGSSSTTCRDWRDCQRQALDAAERKEYETFHDLAWRAMQTGPRNDPALMYLLARAQCLSGRPHDALIMLQRLAQTGTATDADTNDDFRATRALPGWPEVQALIERARSTGGGPLVKAAPGAPPAASTAAAAATTRAPKNFPVVKPDRVEDAVHIAMPRFAPGGLAYDVVSRRFVAADLLGRKLVVVNDGGDHAVDLVRADSAGFHDIAALEIDARRGDLWVATGSMDRDWAVHKLQLLSGRPLKSVKAADLEPLTIVDLGVTPAGTVLALDSLGSRVLALKAQGSRLETVARLNGQNAVSLATTGEEGIVYVAHRGGVSRVDIRTGTASSLVEPAGLAGGTIERLRSYENSLVAVQVSADGSRRLLRLDLNSSGRSITTATVIDAAIGGTGPTFATISGNDLSYITGSGANATRSENAPSASVDFVVRRIRLR